MNQLRPGDSSSPSSDGRRRRGEDNRARIVTAVVALVREGKFTPSAEEVALRADVSLRTVFRHFEDMERLYAQIKDPIEAELLAVSARPFIANDWRGQLVEMVGRRAAAFEAIAPLRRAADLHRHQSAVLADAHQRLATGLRAILNRIAPAEVAATPLIEALDVLLSFETWERLRQVQRLSDARAREVLETTIRALIDRAEG
jgi:AcrR family transcriptional regulator